MNVEDFKGVVYQAPDRDQLEAVLMRRHGNGVNEFWLSHGNDRYPAIVLSVKGDLAAVHYFPKEGHPGFTLTGNLAGLQPGETKFWISAGGETIDVMNDAVIPFAVALAVANEFLISDELPRSLEWFEL